MQKTSPTLPLAARACRERHTRARQEIKRVNAECKPLCTTDVLASAREFERVVVESEPKVRNPRSFRSAFETSPYPPQEDKAAKHLYLGGESLRHLIDPVCKHVQEKRERWLQNSYSSTHHPSMSSTTERQRTPEDANLQARRQSAGIHETQAWYVCPLRISRGAATPAISIRTDAYQNRSYAAKPNRTVTSVGPYPLTHIPRHQSGGCVIALTKGNHTATCLTERLRIHITYV